MGIADGLRKLKNLGAVELTFEVDGLTLTLKTLSPDGENDAQVFADEVYRTLPDDTEDEAKTQLVVWMDRYKLAVLCQSTVQLGDTDLRGVKTIETGESNEQGTPIRVQKHVFLREIMGAWTRAVRDVCFMKYGELLYTSEQKARKGVSFEMVDIDSEVSRVETELARLKQLRGDMDTPSVAQQVAEGRFDPPQQSQPSQQPESQQAPPPQKKSEPESSLSEEEEQMAEEEQRLLELRIQRQPDPEPEPPPVAVERVPLNRQKPEFLNQGQGEAPPQQIRAAKGPKLDPRAPVFREETEVLGGESTPQEAPPKSGGGLVLDQAPKGGVNPKFRPRRGGG